MARKSANRSKGTTKNIVAIDYTSDGRYIVSVGRDAAVRFWDVHSGEQIGIKVSDHAGRRSHARGIE